MKTRMMMCAVAASAMLGMEANAATNGYATWYTNRTARPQRTDGVTAGGNILDESRLWCALPERPPIGANGQRAWGRKIRITNIRTVKSIICEQWDYGPGRGAQACGVCVDLTPAAFLALGGKLEDGRLAVKVEVL